MRIAALDRKLLRDLAGMKGQALAIGLVLASGIAMYVAYLSNFDSLQRTRAAYYDRLPLRLRVRVVQAGARCGSRSAWERSPASARSPDPRGGRRHARLEDVAEPVKGRLIASPRRAAAPQ